MATRRHLEGLSSPDGEPGNSRGPRLVPAPGTTSEQLLHAVALGDERAFEALFDRFGSVVYGVGRAVLRDPHQAEEVAQEVLLEVWRTAPRFDPQRGSARAWISTMAHRRAVDRVRSAQASRRRDAVKLAYYGANTQSQVATLLKLPLGTIKTRMRDGLIRLRDCLGVGSDA